MDKDTRKMIDESSIPDNYWAQVEARELYQSLYKDSEQRNIKGSKLGEPFSLSFVLSQIGPVGEAQGPAEAAVSLVVALTEALPEFDRLEQESWQGVGC